jgi:uncharacterized protein (TIRG00374 family)
MIWLKSWRFWLSCALSLLCLWFAFHKVPLDQLVQAVVGANWLLLLAAVGAQLLAVVTRSRRWLVVLGKDTGLADAFWAQGVGFLFTNIFPLRLGEPARVLVMAERCELPVMQVAASAVVERLFDVATNELVLLLVLPWMQVPPLMNRAAVSFGILGLIGVGILLLLVRLGPQSERLVRAVCLRLPFLPVEKIVLHWRELVRGFQPVTRWRVALPAVGWSLVTWTFSIAVYWSVLRAFQPDSRMVEAAFMTVALSFAVAVPSSPGFVGVFQLVGQQALVLPFGTKYTAASALAITLTAHLIYYLFTTTLGVIGLWRLGESFVNLGQVLVVERTTRKTPVGEITP